MRAASAGIETGRVEEADGVAVAGHPVDRLAQPLHLPALERELPGVDHGLVADVEEAHARRLVGREPLLAGAHDTEAPAVAVDVVPEGVPDVGALGEGPDGVGRDQADPAEDGVGHERVAMEEPLLVVAQREVVERAGAVPPHDVAGPDLGGAPAHGGTPGGQPAIDDRPGQQVQRHHDEADPHGQQADGGVAVDGGREGHPVDADQALGGAEEARRASRAGGDGGHGRPPRRRRSRPGSPPRPPTARMTKAVTTVPRSVWARKRSRSTISSVRTPAQTTSVMTSAACSRWSASEAMSKPDGDEPRAALAPQDPAGQHDHPDAGDGGQRAGRLHDGDGQVLRDEVQVLAQRRRDRGQQVDGPGHEQRDGGETADAPDPDVVRRHLGRRRPRRAARPAGRQLGVDVGRLGAALDDGVGGDQPLAHGGQRQVGLGQEQADVQLGAGLDLEGRLLAVVQEGGRQAEAAPVLVHDLGGGAGAGEEPGVEVGQLGHQGAADDHAGDARLDGEPGGVEGVLAVHLEQLVGDGPRARRVRRPRARAGPRRRAPARCRVT